VNADDLVAVGWAAVAFAVRVAGGVAETFSLWLPAGGMSDGFPLGLVLGASAALLYLWWRWR
jgi:hypothetical protein